MYAAIATRPVSSTVGILSQYAANPGQTHLKGVNRIMRYLKGTLYYGLKLEATR